MKHSFFRMDEQVLYTMGTVCLIALLIMAFKTAIHTPCDAIKINFSKDSVFVNEPVEIRTSAKGKTYAWSLGDKLSVNETGAKVLKTYTKASTYFIKVRVDGDCDHIQMLTVYDRGDIDTDEGFAVKGPDVIFPTEAYLNESVQFHDASRSSESWEWYFEKSREPQRITRTVNYTFKTLGTQNISLIVNKNRNQIVTYQINVIKRPVESIASNGVPNQVAGGGAPRPRRQPRVINDAPSLDVEEEEEEKVVIPVPEEIKPKVVLGEKLNKAQLELFLKEVSKGIKTAKDFNIYSCGQNVSVLYEKRKMSLSEFCADLNGMRRIKKITADVVVKTNNECIQVIKVDIDKRLI